MTFRALPLPAGVPGTVWLHSMPGRRESWPDFVQRAQAVGLTRIVCLTPWHEVLGGAPAYARAIQDQSLPCAWQALPMADFGLSDDAQAFADAVRELAQATTRGEHLLLKCLGLSAEDALHTVQRAGSNPQSALQSGWVDAF